MPSGNHWDQSQTVHLCQLSQQPWQYGQSDGMQWIEPSWEQAWAQTMLTLISIEVSTPFSILYALLAPILLLGCMDSEYKERPLWRSAYSQPLSIQQSTYRFSLQQQHWTGLLGGGHHNHVFLVQPSVKLRQHTQQPLCRCLHHLLLGYWPTGAWAVVKQDMFSSSLKMLLSQWLQRIGGLVFNT